MLDNLKYRYFISYPIVYFMPNMPTEIKQYVVPFDIGTSSIKETLQNGEMFPRKTFNGKVTLRNYNGQNDYSFVKSIEDGTWGKPDCMQTFFVIEKNIGYPNEPLYEEYWRGQFNARVDCEYNTDDCIVEFTPTVFDDYTCFLKTYDKEYNIVDCVKPTMPGSIKSYTSARIFDYAHDIVGLSSGTYSPPSGLNNGQCIASTEQTYGIDASPGTYSPSDGWMIYKNKNGYPRPDGWPLVTTTEILIQTTYIREMSYEDTQTPPAGSGWIYKGVVIHIGEQKHLYVRQPIDSSSANYNKNTCKYLGYYSFGWALDMTGISNIVYYNYGKYLYDVIEYFLNKIECGISKYESKFFNSPVNPVLYEHFNISRTLKNTSIHQSTNIKTPSATEPATKWNLSLKSLLNNLREMFQVHWWIEGTTLYVEHISDNHFKPTSNYINLKIIDDGKWIKRKNKYSYLKNQMPTKERWTQSLSLANTDFKGTDIEYSNVCTLSNDGENVSSHTISNLYSDIELAQSSPSDIPNDGFFIIDSYFDISYNGLIINIDVGELSGEAKNNNLFSIANLQHYFWRHERVMLKGKMNEKDTDFISRIYTRAQEPIHITYCDDIGFFDPITTEMGTGKIISIETKLKDESLTLEIKYDGY